MKNILYICPRKQYDWNVVIPRQVSSPTEKPAEEIEISVLLLQHGTQLGEIPASHVSVLEGEGGAKASPSYEQISYQKFLEKIFLADVALVV